MREDFDLNAIALVLALAGHGTMSAAAKALGLDVSTVSRRISAVEKSLDVRLFIRTGSTCALTDAGRVFVEHAERIVGDIESMLLATTDNVSGTAGLVRITSTELLLDHWLVDFLPGLKADFPGIQVQLVVADRNLSFTRREADFALRLMRPEEDAALVMRKFGDLGYWVYAAPAFADVPRAEWPSQPWISYDDSLSHTPEMQWVGALGPRTRTHLRVNSLGTMIRACVAGNGFALMPSLLGDVPGLVRLSEGPETSREVWLLSHRDAGSVARFRAVADWLRGCHDASRERFSGSSLSTG